MKETIAYRGCRRWRWSTSDALHAEAAGDGNHQAPTTTPGTTSGPTTTGGPTTTRVHNYVGPTNTSTRAWPPASTAMSITRPRMERDYFMELQDEMRKVLEESIAAARAGRRANYAAVYAPTTSTGASPQPPRGRHPPGGPHNHAGPTTTSTRASAQASTNRRQRRTEAQHARAAVAIAARLARNVRARLLQQALA